mgnify:CR=1 FL=1
MSVYIKKKSDGAIMHSCSLQTVTNPEHLKSCQDFVTSRGMSLSDFIIADATDDAVKIMVDEYKEASASYADKRRRSYPLIGDQLDMQYKDLINGTTTWKDHIAKVKSDNPKG